MRPHGMNPRRGPGGGEHRLGIGLPRGGPEPPSGRFAHHHHPHHLSVRPNQYLEHHAPPSSQPACPIRVERAGKSTQDPEPRIQCLRTMGRKPGRAGAAASAGVTGGDGHRGRAGRGGLPRRGGMRVLPFLPGRRGGGGFERNPGGSQGRSRQQVRRRWRVGGRQ